MKVRVLKRHSLRKSLSPSRKFYRTIRIGKSSRVLIEKTIDVPLISQSVGIIMNISVPQTLFLLPIGKHSVVIAPCRKNALTKRLTLKTFTASGRTGLSIRTLTNISSGRSVQRFLKTLHWGHQKFSARASRKSNR
jgi:hypothetical protein